MPNEPSQTSGPTSGLSSPAPSGTPTNAPAPSPPPSPWRAGPNAPAWARDKTADEILGIANQLVEGLGRPSAPAPAQPMPPAAPVGAPPGYVDPTAYVTGQDLNNAVQAAANQFTPALQRLADQNAASTYRLVASDPRFTEVFQKYPQEIVNYLGRIPKAEWTVDIVEGAGKLVRADHIDELARERATQLVQTMEPTIRPTGGGATPVQPTTDLSLKSDKLPQDWRERAAKAGLDERSLDEFCYANNISREQFFAQFGKGLIVEIGRVGQK